MAYGCKGRTNSDVVRFIGNWQFQILWDSLPESNTCAYSSVRKTEFVSYHTGPRVRDMDETYLVFQGPDDRIPWADRRRYNQRKKTRHHRDDE